MFQNDLMKGQRILVTGGGTGLGKAMTERYMSLGADCVIWGRRSGVLEETAAELMAKTGGVCEAMAVDIRDPMAIEAAVEAIWDKAPLTGLVNNAAGNFVSRTEDLSPNAFNAIASIVMHGTFNVTNAVGKRWLEGGLKGNILSIVTTWVWTGSAYVVPSAMSKAGVAAMTQSLAVEWGNRGIRLNAIAPGPFPTKGAWDRLMPGTGEGRDYIDTVPMKRVGEYGELANLATFLMAPGADYVTGQIIAIDGGQMLTGGGTFSMLEQLTDDQWQMMRAQVKSANEASRKERG
ncbi:SDR family oxidoreductase [Kordiimonas marina]|uniref:SDR family oxidoreductase n=1 Tax=Kordiimonas marina TaxID=2872312 RepID=UPI001FF5CFF1|nr:SDR family oxidoreductase [Kordiimonas marina]MCJ9428336.1 SDR family oxidoreductase [Kordiimonas marina]